MQSNVGNPQVYGAGDQRPQKMTGPEKGTVNAPPRFEAAPDNAHIDTDSKDERTLGNRANASIKHQEEEENTRTITDPLQPALSHGNKPSRGAQIDADIQAEEEELLRRKGAA